MARIGAAVQASQSGEREAARSALLALWDELDTPLQRCAVAHALADVQDDLAAELSWDERALEAAGGVTDAEVAAAQMPGTARSLLPSLHLNLGDGYRRLGDIDNARRHCHAGLAAAHTLPDDGYGAMIRRGLARLAERLDVAPASPSPARGGAFPPDP